MDESADDVDDWVDILGSGDLKKKIISYDGDVNDTSTRPVQGQKVKIELTLVRSGETDPSKPDRKEFIIGDNDVPYFLELVLPMMHVTEVCRVRTTAKFNDYPLDTSESHAEYEVNLINVEDVPPLSEWSVEDRMKTGSLKKARGNKLFEGKKYDSAILSFRKAVKYLTDDLDDGPDELKALASTCLANLAAVYLKIPNHKEAVSCCDGALLLNETNVKAFYRKAKALHAMKDYSEAFKAIQELMTIDNNNVAGKKLQKQIQMDIDASKKSEKEMYRRMVTALDGSSKDVQKIIKDQEDQEAEAMAKARESRNTILLWVLLGVLVALVLASTLFKVYNMYDANERLLHDTNQNRSVIYDAKEL